MEPLLLMVKEAARVLRVGRTRVWDMIRTGQLRSFELGRLRRISRKCTLRVSRDRHADP